jgi:predicted  nucleic acid-binding Zn-ribbon protein
MTRAQVAQLWTLQQVDVEIERATAERDAHEATLAGDPTQAARAALAQATRATQVRGERQRTAETTLDETRHRLQQQEVRLYAGSVPAKDLDKLQHEIEHLRAIQATQEEAVLAAMEAVEVAERAVVGRQLALRAAEEAHERDRVRAGTQLSAVEVRLAALSRQRQEQAARCSPDMLTRYESVRRAHGGRALAEVRDETREEGRAHICQGCRVKLTDVAYQRARTATELALCSNCGRILYIP